MGGRSLNQALLLNEACHSKARGSILETPYLSKRSEYLGRIGELLMETKEYEIEWSVLSTDDHGVPHKREAMYYVGIRKDVQ